MMEDSLLHGKRMAIGISGGIACYKIAELVSRLNQAGASTQVVMTEAATRFIAPLTFQSLSGLSVITDIWDLPTLPHLETGNNAWHIALAEWADLCIIAPASADVIARIAGGLTNDPLSLLASALVRDPDTHKLCKPALFAPAMNTNMWLNPANQKNCIYLRDELGFEMVAPESGWQACRNKGMGRLVEPTKLRERITERLGK